MPQSLAFKCTYNDGDSEEFVGLRGTCSLDLIAFNVENHVWCMQPQNPCKKFREAGMQGNRPEFPCMESKLFEKWKFNGGAWHHGRKKGQPIAIRNTAVGKIVILTTRRRDQSERDRKIIGMYEIGEVDRKGSLIASEDFRVRLLSTEADQLNFWRYYRNTNGDIPKWGTLLFRYLDYGQVHRILADSVATVGDSSRKETLRALIARKFGNAPPPPPAGAIANEDSVEKRVALARKYPGGEGQNHLDLKNWIAENPSSIGLPVKSQPSIEHIFRSGDCVDIAFKLPDGCHAAVEIETTDPFPGAHQVIKYRALLAAQQGWALDTTNALGILVAWDFSPIDLAFCRKYGIAPWKCRTGECGRLRG